MTYISEHFDHDFSMFSDALEILHRSISAPVAKKFETSFVYRYEEEGVKQALVLKLAKRTTDLISADLLRSEGYYNTQCSVQRMISEADEDIQLLFHAIHDEKFPEIAKEWLIEFFAEEFDLPSNPLDSTQKRKSIPRKRIQKYITRLDGSPNQIAHSRNLLTTLYKMYSGFLHGAAPQILEMYGGNPKRFHVKGMLGTPRETENFQDYLNYVYRGYQSFRMAAIVFRNDDLDKLMKECAVTFNQQYQVE